MESLISKLELQPHPEGGFYKETYRSANIIQAESLPKGFAGTRHISTSIYFLLPATTFSAFHAIKSDECWHFYEGLPIQLFIIEPNGVLNVIKLGKDLENGEVYQAVVPANCWFASRPVGEDNYSLAGCTVAPGFDFTDFTMPDRHELLALYPQHEKIVMELTR